MGVFSTGRSHPENPVEKGDLGNSEGSGHSDFQTNLSRYKMAYMVILL